MNPTWFHDFYPANGFSILFLRGTTNVVKSPEEFDLPAFERFFEVPRNSIMLFAARREEARPLTMPVQHKYVVNPGLRK